MEAPDKYKLLTSKYTFHSSSAKKVRAAEAVDVRPVRTSHQVQEETHGLHPQSVHWRQVPVRYLRQGILRKVRAEEASTHPQPGEEVHLVGD